MLLLTKLKNGSNVILVSYREWNQKKSLRRGFPQYYINGQKVNKKQYLKACTQNDFLPKFQEMDNHSHRELAFTHLEA